MIRNNYPNIQELLNESEKVQNMTIYNLERIAKALEYIGSLLYEKKGVTENED